MFVAPVAYEGYGYSLARSLKKILLKRFSHTTTSESVVSERCREKDFLAKIFRDDLVVKLAEQEDDLVARHKLFAIS